MADLLLADADSDGGAVGLQAGERDRARPATAAATAAGSLPRTTIWLWKPAPVKDG